MDYETEHIVQCLNSGGIVLIPTDTVYGLAVNPAHSGSVQQLYAMKGRPVDRNFPIMAANEGDLVALGIDVNAHVRKLLQSRYVPGPLTIAVGFRDAPTVPWLANRVEIAVRIPDNIRMLSVLGKSGPLLVTSANRHGNPCGKNIRDILAELNSKPDMVIDGGELQITPSTLVNCNVLPPVIEREGIIPKEEIEWILGLR